LAEETADPSPQLITTEGVPGVALVAHAKAVTFTGAVPDNGVTLSVIDGAACGATVNVVNEVPLAPRSSVTVAMIV
jgi:hypothetical protein